MVKKWMFIPVGLVVGLANGLFGSGGGTLLVPALQKFFNFETRKSHATALAVILPLSIISALIYIWSAEVDWGAVLWVSLGGAAGGFAGAKLLKKIKPKWLHIIFSLFMAFAAYRMVFS